MPNEEWGTKRLCPTTGKRFYDLNKTPIISPYSGEVVEVDVSKSRMIAADAEDAVTAKAKKKDVEEEDTDLVDDDDVDAIPHRRHYMSDTWGPFVRHGTILFCVLTDFEALNRIRRNE